MNSRREEQERFKIIGELNEGEIDLTSHSFGEDCFLLESRSEYINSRGAKAIITLPKSLFPKNAYIGEEFKIKLMRG